MEARKRRLGSPMKGHTERGRHSTPSTTLGHWSVRLAAISLGLFVFAQALVMSGQRGGENFSDNLLLAIPMFATGLAILSAGVVGVVGIARGERSWVIFTISILGLVVLVFVAGELLVPH